MLPSSAPRGGGPLEMADLLRQIERLARHRKRAVVLAAPRQRVADEKAHERLAGAPPDLARESERLRRGELVLRSAASRTASSPPT